jgi:predicted aldo/keto reductase-like oxidoreductase
MNNNILNRRDFIKKSSLGLLGGGIASQAALPGSQPRAGSELPRIREYRTLGRTGFKVSDIGSGEFDDVGPFITLLDGGVNYIDTSEDYGQHGRQIGQAIKGRDRGSLFITSKLRADASVRRIGKEGITKEGFMRRAQRVMVALQTDYLDCLMLSSPETTEALSCEGYHEAARQLKKEGKVRFTGVSHHGSQWVLTEPKESMETVLLAAARDGRFDIFLLAHNFLKEDQSERVLEVCAQKKIGTTLMKTNPIRSYRLFQQWLTNARISKGQDLDENDKRNLARIEAKVENAQDFVKRHNLENDREIRDAALKFCLTNPRVNTVCLTVMNYDDARDFLGLSGSRLKPGEGSLLASYREDCGGLYCRHACGLCESACPARVPVNTIMRFDHYFVSQRREKHAMTEYAALQSQADNCQSCAGYCERACPYGLPVRALLCSAHQTLAFGSSEP